MPPIDILLRKLKYHSPIDPADVAALRRLRCEIRELASGEEFIRQGDRPKAAAIVVEGALAIRAICIRSSGRSTPGSLPVRRSAARGLFRSAP